MDFNNTLIKKTYKLKDGYSVCLSSLKIEYIS